MMQDEINFYPKFPFIESNILDPYYGIKFNDAIVTKKEFAIEKLNKIEPLPTTPGHYLRHQKYISRYMTIYDELLLFHEPGTGKTCTAIAAIEAIRYDKDSNIKRAIVCAKGEGLTKNFLQEFIFTCTDGRYIPDNYDELTDIQKNTKTKKIASVFYSFKTFETFAKDLSSMTTIQLKNLFEDTIFIIDEVHNIREHSDISSDIDILESQPKDKIPSINNLADGVFKSKRNVNIYNEFHKLFHILERRKIILLSGTPIKDTPDEFASIMNLILPIDKQLAVDTFIKTYFNADLTALVNEKTLADIIRGRVSYLKAVTTTVMKKFVGKTIGNLRYFIVYESMMDDFQSIAYAKAYQEDKISKSIFINSRQASLFVYPDGSYGAAGFKKYVLNTRELFRLIKSIKNISHLRKYSIKYAQLISIIQSEPKSKHFVYCQYVGGSGAIILCKILEAFGFKRAFGNENTKSLRYALCSRYDSSSKQIQKIVNRFNNIDNIDGEYISILIGSKVLNEGYTLKNIRNEFIMTGHWNYSETAQAIARGWRLGSHDALLNRGDIDVHVNVYQCVSIPKDIYMVPSIDLELYETAEKKDIVNRLIERLIKENAFDCALTVDRNKIYGYDGQRECDYKSCEYICDGKIGSPIDTSTYNLLKDIKDEVKFNVTSKLIYVFTRHDEYTIEKLNKDLKYKYTMNLLVEAIYSIIEDSTFFYNSHGFPYFLGIKDKSTIFLTLDPASKSIGYLNEYYTLNKIMEVAPQIVFKNLLSDLYDKALPDLITQLFNYPSLTRALIVDLPYTVQRIILEGCLLAKLANLSKNNAIRSDILDFYSGFYGVRNDKLTIWLHSIEIGTRCYDEKTNKFIDCTIIDDTHSIALITSPIGWYGLHNPSSGDFCLRNVEERDLAKKDIEGIDLRKLTVGKRCVNYDKSKLIDIAGEKMKLADISELINKNKKELCSDMKNWFQSKNLLETNFDCGTAQKKRIKFSKP